MVFPTDSCICTHRPYFGLEQTLNPLNKPSKARMSIFYFNNRNTHVYNRAFRKCSNLKGKITKLMKFFNAVTGYIVETQMGSNIVVILIHYLLNGFVKEITKTFMQIYKKRLNTINYHFRKVFIHCFSCSKIGDQHFLIIRIHLHMCLFITIAI